jgi:hypothetical protein
MIGLSAGRASTDLRVVAKQLRTAGDPKAVRKQLLTGLRNGTKPALKAVQAGAASLPSHHGGTPVLRPLLVAAAGIQVRTTGKDAGVAVRIRRAKLGDKAALGKVTNEGSWRHLVFGHRTVWVTQTSRKGWFDNGNRYAAPGVRRELGKVLDGIAKQCEHR